MEYPPPSPPPPSPPVVPPVPVTPPSPYTCSARALPSVANVKDHSFGAWNPGSPLSRDSRSVPCWRWDEAGVWPPQQTHQNIFQELEVCGWRSSRSVQWQSGFRQPTLDSIYRNQFNEDACIWANDGVCQDGGDGDYQSADTTIVEAGAARVLPGNVFDFRRIQSDVPLPPVGAYLMISLVNWRQDGVASNHPSVTPENVCLHGGNANSQTGPLRVTASGTYDSPIDSRPLGFIRAEPVPGVTVYASGRASCEPCPANGYGCGTCNEFATSSNQADWTSDSAVSVQQERPFDCMDVTGVILAPVRRQCNYGSCAPFNSNLSASSRSLSSLACLPFLQGSLRLRRPRGHRKLRVQQCGHRRRGIRLVTVDLTPRGGAIKVDQPRRTVRGRRVQRRRGRRVHGGVVRVRQRRLRKAPPYLARFQDRRQSARRLLRDGKERKMRGPALLQCPLSKRQPRKPSRQVHSEHVSLQPNARRGPD